MMSVAIQPRPFICLLAVVNHAHSHEHTMYFTVLLVYTLSAVVIL